MSSPLDIELFHTDAPLGRRTSTLFPLRGLHFIERDYTNPPRLLSDNEEAERSQRGRLHNLRAARSRVGQAITRRRKAEADVAAPSAAQTLAEKVDGPIAASHPEQPSQVLETAFTPLRRQTTSRLSDAASVREIAGAAHAASPAEQTGSLSAGFGGAGLQQRRPSFGRRPVRDETARDRLRTIVASPSGSVVDDGEITEVGTQSAHEEAIERTFELDVDDKPARIDEKDEVDSKSGGLDESQSIADHALTPQSRSMRILLAVKDFVLSLLTPPTIALVLALICALVKPLKAVSLMLRWVEPDQTAELSALRSSSPLSLIMAGIRLRPTTNRRLPSCSTRRPSSETLRSRWACSSWARRSGACGSRDRYHDSPSPVLSPSPSRNASSCRFSASSLSAASRHIRASSARRTGFCNTS